jgi:hypothetical protein
MTPDEQPRTDGRGKPTVGRRSCLTAAGAVLAAAVGRSTATPDDGTESVPAGVDPLRTHGYGGAPGLRPRQPAAGAVRNGGLLAVMTEREPNDESDRATRVDPGRTVSGTISAADTDWYVFRTAGDAVSVTVESAADAALGVVVYDADGGRATHAHVGSGGAATLRTDSGNEPRQFLEVAPASDGGGTYRFRVDVTTGDGDDTSESSTATPTATNESDDDTGSTPTPTPSGNASVEQAETGGDSETDTETTTPTPTPTPTATETATTTTATTDVTAADYGVQRYGRGGYGGVQT